MTDDAVMRDDLRLPRRPVIGVLHPGTMGAALGSALKPMASAVIWAAAGRSDRTSKRAELADLVGVPDVAELVHRSDLVLSICPPHAARDVAEQVSDALIGRAATPIFVEANAVAPQTVRDIGELLGADHVVDATVIGPPAWERGRSVLWLSGSAAGAVAELFAGSPFEARVLGSDLGAASALKVCFGLQSKVVPALWLELAAAAQRFGVADALGEELARFGVDHAGGLGDAVESALKAWRWSGEMDEAAAAIAAAGLPDGFSRAAAEIYRRLADGRLDLGAATRVANQE